MRIAAASDGMSTCSRRATVHAASSDLSSSTSLSISCAPRASQRALAPLAPAPASLSRARAAARLMHDNVRAQLLHVPPHDGGLGVGVNVFEAVNEHLRVARGVSAARYGGGGGGGGGDSPSR
jgi:hypothetical protein